METTKEIPFRWSYAKMKDIRAILSKYKINKTGRLSKSIKVKFIKNGTGIQFSSVFYSKYVRKYYFNKKGIDIFAPILTVKDLVKELSLDFKKQLIKEMQFSQFNGPLKK